MGLRAQAAADFKTFVEDTADFGWPVTVTDPDGTSASLVGFTTDVHFQIDPDTGQAVVGREASCTLSIASLTAAGLGLPVGIQDQTEKPWIIVFDDTAGAAHTFKVAKAHPDRAIGAVICVLELYRT